MQRNWEAFNQRPRIPDETKSTATAWAAVPALPNSNSLPGIRNLHHLRVRAFARVIHFENVLILADHAKDRFHRNVLLAGRSTTRFAFQGDNFVAVLTFALACENRGLHVTHPNGVERLLDVVVAQEALPGKRLAHHFAVELLLQ